MHYLHFQTRLSHELQVRFNFELVLVVQHKYMVSESHIVNSQHLLHQVNIIGSVRRERERERGI